MKRTRGKKGRIQGRTTPHKSLAEIRQLLGDAPRTRDMLIEHLHKIQDHYKHISNRHILALSIDMKLPMAEVYETATFYHHFDVLKENEMPPPNKTIRVCESLTCEMFGAKQLTQQLNSEDLDNVRIQSVPCVGRCNAAPVAVVGMNPIESADTTKIKMAIDNNELEATEPNCISYADYKK